MCSAYKVVNRLIMVVMINTLFMSAATADLVFTAPPRETVEQGQAVYGPLAEALSEVIDVKVVYQHPHDWGVYQKKILKNEYDIIFDGPHFAAWRIEKQMATPNVKLPGALNFVLVSRKGDVAVATSHDLISRKICALPSPNLGTLTLFSMFPNPVQQPNFVYVKGGFKAVYKALVAGKCEGAILRKAYFSMGIDQQSRAALTVLQESMPLTNQGITVSSNVDAKTAKLILKFLTSQEGQAAAAPLFKRFSKGNMKFLPAKAKDYEGHNLLVEDMIFGW